MHKSDYSSFLPPSVSSFSPVFLNSLLQCSTEISMETRFSSVSRDVQGFLDAENLGESTEWVIFYCLWPLRGGSDCSLRAD